jgi:hypothetical protein
VFLAADRQTITVRVAHAGCVVEFVQSGDFGSGRLSVRFDAGFAALLKNQGEMTFGDPDDRILVRWHDGLVPQSTWLQACDEPKETAVAEPERWETISSEFALAMSEARKICAKDVVRFAMNAICLRGRSGEVASTDGRQLLRWGGFRFPWEEEVLVPAASVFDAAELQASAEGRIGRTEEHVFLRSGPWRIALAIDKQGRFPNVEAVVPTKDKQQTRLVIESGDAHFLHRTLPRLPGSKTEFNPVTIDLNGHVGVRSLEATSATELVLSQSSWSGKARQLVCNRDYLRRAVGLGFREFALGDDSVPVVAQDCRRMYLFIPLTGSKPPPREGATIIDSGQRIHQEGKRSMSKPNPSPAPPPETTPTPNGSGELAPADSPLGMAIALRDHYRDGCRRANELVQAIRQQRRQTRLVESTLASLRELQVGR